MSVKNCIVTEN